MNDALRVYKDTDSVVPLVYREIFEKPETITMNISSLKSGTTRLLPGSVIGMSAGIGYLLKTAVTQAAAAAAATDVRVDKGHQFKVGDVVVYNDVATVITAVTTTETDYDTLSLTATLDAVEAVPVDTVLYQGSAEATNSATESAATVEDTADDFLEIANPRGTTNDIIVTISQNSSDALSVTYTPSTKTLAIALAKTTAASNNAAAIQTAIRALAQSGGVDFTDWTATGTGWDGGQTGATLTDPSHRMSGGVPKPSYINPKYTDIGFLYKTVDFDMDEDSNIMGSVIRAASIDESQLPWEIPTCFKTILTDRCRFY